MAIRAVVFDLDGTLVGLRTLLRSIAKTLRSFNLSLRKTDAKEHSHKRPKDAFSDLFPDYKHLADQVEQAFVRHYRNEMKQSSISSPYAYYTLKSLKRSGLKVGILSNNSKRVVTDSMKHTRLHCDAVLSADDVENPKPDPRALFAVLSCLQTNPEETVYVGDTPQDIQQGKRAGVITVGVTTGMYSAKDLKKARPDYIISNVSQVLDIVRQ